MRLDNLLVSAYHSNSVDKFKSMNMFLKQYVRKEEHILANLSSKGSLDYERISQSISAGFIRLYLLRGVRYNLHRRDIVVAVIYHTDRGWNKDVYFPKTNVSRKMIPTDFDLYMYTLKSSFTFMNISLNHKSLHLKLLSQL